MLHLHHDGWQPYNHQNFGSNVASQSRSLADDFDNMFLNILAIGRMANLGVALQGGTASAGQACHSRSSSTIPETGSHPQQQDLAMPLVKAPNNVNLSEDSSSPKPGRAFKRLVAALEDSDDGAGNGTLQKHEADLKKNARMRSQNFRRIVQTIVSN